MSLFSRFRKQEAPADVAATPPFPVAAAPAALTGIPRERPLYPVCCIMQDFFVFRGVLFARGYTEVRDGLNPKARFRLWDGEVVEPALHSDPTNPCTHERFAFSISYPLPGDVTPAQIRAINLVLDYAGGRFEVASPAGDGQSEDAFYASEKNYWAQVQASPNARVLEIGSRARSGITRRNLFPATCEYTGLDISAGENVDVVGDAHRMSSFLPHDHFDFAFSISVWEHLCMPWVASLELNRVMKLGGVVMIGTHPAWPAHEEPWDYFRFSNFSWDALFNRDTGFEIVERGTGVKCVMGPSRYFEPVAASQLEWHDGFLATRCIARKVGATQLQWPVPPETVTRGTYSH